MKYIFDIDGTPKVVNGHKFWKPQEYKGRIIQPYESPDGERTFLVGDSKQWVYNSKKLEDCGAFIDMLDIADKFNKAEQNDTEAD